MISTQKLANGVYQKTISGVVDTITQDEKDELDTLLTTHQGDAPDFVSLTCIKIGDSETGKRLLGICYKNSADEDSIHYVTL